MTTCRTLPDDESLALRDPAGGPGRKQDKTIPGMRHVNYAGDIQAFATACEAHLPLRLNVTDERSGRSDDVLLDRPFAVIGSAESCDVRLVHPAVSRNHAYLQVLGNRVLCFDLSSRTGIHWEAQIRFRSWLLPGEAIQIGPFSLRLATVEAGEAESVPPASAGLAAPARVRQPSMILTFLNARSRSGRSRISRVRDPVTLIGWSHLCHLRLQHRSVGRAHCSLVWTASGLWAVDLMCRGGTRVNGEFINFARLDDDDELEMGRFRLKIAYGSSGEMPILSADDPEPAEVSHSWSAMPEPEAEFEPASSRVVAQFPRLASDAAQGQEVQARTVARIAAPSELTALRTSPVPVATALPALTVSDPNTAALMQQFAAMQQQMFDHTYHLLSVVTQAFQTAHDRQLQLIREELMHVHDLNRELQELNRQRGTADADSSAAPAAVNELLQRLHPGSPDAAPPAETASAPAARPVVSAPTAQPAPATAPPSPAGQLRRPAPAAAIQKPVSGADRGNTPRDAVGAVPARQPVRGGSVSPESSPAAKSADPDPHAWLSGRIDELTRERSSRWQRILQLLTSGGS